MTNLFRSEFLRFRSRSMVVGLIVAALLVIPVVLFIMTLTSEPPTQTQLANAEEGYQECLRISTLPQGEAQAELDVMYSSNDYSGPFFSGWCNTDRPWEGYAPGLALVSLPVGLGAAAVFWIGLGLLMGASSVGGDWHSRSLTTLLTWEARRTRVFIARVATVGVSVFLIAMFFQATLSAGFALVTALRGTWFHVDPTWAVDAAELALRISVLAGIAAALGATLAMAVRTTAGAIGLLFAYALLESFMAATAYHPVLWNYGASLVAFVSQEPLELRYDYRTRISHVLTPGMALPIMLIYTAVFLFGGWAVFRSRDIN